MNDQNITIDLSKLRPLAPPPFVVPEPVFAERFEHYIARVMQAVADHTNALTDYLMARDG